jgi:hypothetical protein
LASACGVTTPLNKASKANGIDGNGVWERVGKTTCVAVGKGLVGLLSGVSTGADVWVNSGDVSGVRVFSTGIGGRLNFGSRETTVSKTPAATNAPRTEKAVCARTLFCWRMT